MSFPEDKKAFILPRLLTIGVSISILLAPFIWRQLFTSGGPPLCTFRSFFGLPCPGCGLTRAFVALSKFDWLSALQLNAFSIPLALFFLVAPFVAISELALGRKFAWYQLFFSVKFAKVFATALIGYHFVRLVVWVLNGTLVNEYLKSGQLYRLFFG